MNYKPAYNIIYIDQLNGGNVSSNISSHKKLNCAYHGDKLSETTYLSVTTLLLKSQFPFFSRHLLCALAYIFSQLSKRKQLSQGGLLYSQRVYKVLMMPVIFYR